MLFPSHHQENRVTPAGARRGRLCVPAPAATGAWLPPPGPSPIWPSGHPGRQAYQSPVALGRMLRNSQVGSEEGFEPHHTVVPLCLGISASISPGEYLGWIWGATSGFRRNDQTFPSFPKCSQQQPRKNKQNALSSISVSLCLSPCRLL